MGLIRSASINAAGGQRPPANEHAELILDLREKEKKEKKWTFEVKKKTEETK